MSYCWKLKIRGTLQRPIIYQSFTVKTFGYDFRTFEHILSRAKCHAQFFAIRASATLRIAFFAGDLATCSHNVRRYVTEIRRSEGCYEGTLQNGKLVPKRNSGVCLVFDQLTLTLPIRDRLGFIFFSKRTEA